MKNTLAIVSLTTALLASSACASKPKNSYSESSRPVGSTADTVIVTPASITKPEVTSSRAYSDAHQPVMTSPVSMGMPVYEGPKIVQTVLAPFQDEKGRLFGPQIMYEKIEEGRWNPDALANPDLAYIPQENMVVPPGMGNPVSSPAAKKAAIENPSFPLDILDLKDVVVTGLIAKEANESEAREMAAHQGGRAVFNADLGWIIVPKPAQQ